MTKTIKIMIYSFLLCLKEMIEKELKNLESEEILEKKGGEIK